MSKRLVFALIGIASIFFDHTVNAQFIYINPKPGSLNHYPQTTIALNPGFDVDAAALNASYFGIVGSVSGNHTCQAILSTDGHTIILKPHAAFAWKESVTVRVKNGIRLADGETLQGTQFSFTIRPEPSKKLIQYMQSSARMEDETGEVPAAAPAGTVRSFPSFLLLANNNPSPGTFLFCNKNDADPEADAYLVKMENDGSTLNSLITNNRPNDWKQNDNCLFTFFDQVNLKWRMVDSAYDLLDEFQCGNGLEMATDAHDFRIYPDGHCWIEADDALIIDMSQIVPGGDTAAMVRGFTLQRLDAAHNVVFQWRSWDYFNITDAVVQVPLTTQNVDYAHGNSIEEDTDGNVIVSFRHMCEITKINSVTGEIIWRWGGEHNQFTFVNDISNPGFYFQHYVRRMANGHLSVFNNANYQLPQASVAKEYALNENTLTATLVWSYKHPDVNGAPVFAKAGGSMQRLPDGHSLIAWGMIAYSGDPNFTEIDSQGNIVFELQFEDSNQSVYRCTKSVWQTCNDEVSGTGGDPLHQYAAFSVEPNPSEGDVMVRVPASLSGTATLSILDYLGHTVWKQEVTNTSGTLIHASLSYLPKGIYFCQWREGTNREVQKLLLQ